MNESTSVLAGAPQATPPDSRYVFPTSYAQRRLWFLHQLEPESPAYNITLYLRLRGALSPEVLERSLTELTRRHESLRTTFPVRDGEPVQQIHPPTPIGLRIVDLGAPPVADVDQAARAIRREEAARPFDLGAGPLCRACLVRRHETDHELLVTMHHIVSDGWSKAILTRELGALYAAFRDGVPSPLPDPEIQYADYSVWQRDWLQGSVLDQQLGYWTARLLDVPTLDLPADFTAPHTIGRPGATVVFTLPDALIEQLHALGRREGATLFMVLLAGFQWLLGQYAGQQDVAVGTAIANRRRKETEGIVGFLVNTLVMRVDLGGAPSVRELVARVRGLAVEAYAHQDLPFECLVEAVNPQRMLGRTPLFQVMFSVENDRPAPPQIPGLDVAVIDGGELALAKFDLMLILAPAANGYQGELQYAADRHERETIEQIARHYERLLACAVREPDTPLPALTLSDERDARQVIEWNRTATSWCPLDRGVHELFARHAAERPTATAIVQGDRSVTYAELDRQSNQRAHFLRGRGVQPEDRVGLCMERGVEMVAWLLGIVKAGAAYVPLDPAYPAERLATMVRDVRAGLVVTERRFQDRHAGAAPIVCLEDVRESIAASDAGPVAGASDGARLAYVMFTSGSTGVPKGIMIPHRAIARLVVDADYVRLDATDRVAQISNASFDAATFEIWGALLNAAAIVILDQDTVLDPAALARELRRHRVTTAFLTTALFNQTAREAASAFAGLRTVLFGGEAVDPVWVRQVLASGAPERLLHVYGPTETTTFATWHPVPDVAPRQRRIPIGRPIGHTQAYILDEQMRLAVPGMPGEIFIGGPGVARGYWDRPALTAERFVPDPFGATPGSRLYRTGDRARCRADGEIEFLGRCDDQVKLRGHRIEPGEIDATLKQHAGVQDAVTILRDERDDKRLIAYLVPVPGASLDVQQIRQMLRHRLPDYMVPAALVSLARLPLTANGKLDRRALPTPARDELALQTYLAPRTELEETVCRMWSEILRVDRVGVADNFFDLGGHSLLATRVMSRVRADLGIELPLRTFFEQPTPAELAAVLATRLAEPASVPPLLARVSRAERLPLSPAQRRVWFLQQLEPESGAYNVPFFLRLAGSPDLAALEWSLTEIVSRHEVLRTSCPARRGEPQQEIDQPSAVRLPVIDLSRLEPGTRGAVAAALRQDEADRPFDLGRAPLWRVQLLRLQPALHELLLTMHHIVTDGWSEAIFVAELKALYEAHREGRPSPLPDLPVQYADFAAWQERAAAAGAMAGQVDYWRRQLDSVPVLDLPTDRQRTQAARHPQDSRPVRLSAGAADDLRRFAHRERATPFMVLLAAFQWVLSRYGRQPDVAVGSVVANRTHAEIEPLIGFFVNTLVFRARMTDAETFRALVRRVRDVALDAYAHQDVPFERLVEELNPDRDLGRTPFFQALMTLQNTPAGVWELPGLQIDEIDVELRDAKFELNLTLRETADGLEGSASFAADLFDADSIDQLLRHYAAFLEAALADPDRALSALPLLSRSERDAIVFDRNRTAAPHPQPGTIVDRLDDRARQHPEAIAVIGDGTPLTYGELGERANRLAHYLIARGVTPETRVAVYLERGLDWAATVLAIWKANGVYVPLDPAYPRDRHAFVLDDARVAVVLTDQTMRDDLPPHPATVCLDLEWEAVEQQPAAPPCIDLLPTNLAYVMYTSGSTGKPKGVMIEHRGMMNHLWAKVVDLGLGAHDVVAQNAPASFDISVWQLLAPLLVGGRVTVLGDEISRDAFRLLGEIDESRITVFETVPSLFAVMIEQEERSGADRRPLPRLRCVISNAEALPLGLGDRWMALYPHVRLLNTYGATECSDDVTHQTLHAAHRRRSAFAPLGAPLANLTVYVLDDHLQPVPHGVAGELYLGGAGVGRGYLDRPMLTAERFVPDPFGSELGARLYRTGDLGRLNRDGSLEFLGRIDLQVKVRGHRVELGEIEDVLLEHDAVGQVVVLRREDVPGDERLVAYVVAGDDGSLASRLGAFLATRLPDYMVPSAFVTLDAMPLTVNGKVDRRALPPPEGRDPVHVYAAPRNELEAMLCGLWAQLLRAGQVGVHDNFFALGGHSLLATQVISRVRSALEVNVPLAALFRSPTVSGFAEEVTRAREADRVTTIVPADRAAFRSKRATT